MNGVRVSCVDKTTGWNLRSDAPIAYLDRQNVECPKPYFLARFQLGRQADRATADVRYSYRCCMIIL